jgi:REP element-mobilizing transposase RayT
MSKTIKTEFQRRLPHFQYPGATYFITSHLDGSIPYDVLKKLKDQREKTIEEINRQNPPDKLQKIYMAHRAFFLAYDDWLDRCENSPAYLKDPVVAKILVDALYEYNGKFYNLVAYTIMPNHFHVLLDFSVQIPVNQPFELGNYVDLSKSLNLVKGRSSRFSNLYLNRTGNPFWGIESFDRYIRDYRHFSAAVDYIKNNPVKAKLCLHWLQHPFTWVREDYLKMKLIFPGVRT